MYLGVHTPADVFNLARCCAAAGHAGLSAVLSGMEQRKMVHSADWGFACCRDRVDSLYRACSHAGGGHIAILSRVRREFLQDVWRRNRALFRPLAGAKNCIRFSVKAVWWAQILGCLGEHRHRCADADQAPLLATSGGLNWGNEKRRYFLMVLVGGTLWPLSFRFGKLGHKKEQAA